MKIYNTLTRKKETFKPQCPGEVRMYACGPTVYNFFHIGNARPFIVFDTLRRYFKYRGYKVLFVQNFTDIDDKMINRAREEGITVKALGDRFIEEYKKDAEALNISPPTVAPKATEHIGEIIALIQKLVDNKKAYVAEAGVYFDTSAFAGYGKLSGQSLEDLEMGARVDVSEEKKNPMDFVLWKRKKPGEPSWDSPWGEGRPGWHIECSAMSMKYLGDTLDIHGGGQDLVFPHHENEIAQSEGATGKPFANYWMHNGYITVDNQKMSKSKNNFFMVRDIQKLYDLMAVRMFILSAHYRSPINFSRELVEQAHSALIRIENCIGHLDFVIQNGEGGQPKIDTLLNGYEQKFIEAMDDDFNTADAIGVIFELIKKINIRFEKSGKKTEAAMAKQQLETLLDVLGIKAAQTKDDVPESVKTMAEQREQARRDRDFEKADRLRDELKNLGYEIKDTPQGAKISRMNQR